MVDTTACAPRVRMRVTIESIFVTASSSAATFSSSTIVIPARANSGRRYFKLFVSVGTSTYVSPILVAVVKRLTIWGSSRAQKRPDGAVTKFTGESAADVWLSAAPWINGTPALLR